MPRLLASLRASEALSSGLAACHFLATQTGDMVVSLIYGEPMNEDWSSSAEKLRRELTIPSIIGRAKGVRVVLGRDFVDETYALSDGRRLTYRQARSPGPAPLCTIFRLVLCHSTLAHFRLVLCARCVRGATPLVTSESLACHLLLRVATPRPPD